jgi:hypothetical protein
MYLFFFGARYSLCSVQSGIHGGAIVSTFEHSKPNRRVGPCILLPDILTGIALFKSS